MRRAILLLAPIAIATAGCVPQEKYDDLLTAYRAMEQQSIPTRSSRGLRTSVGHAKADA